MAINERHRVLLVEDDRDIREALTTVLEIEGYDVTVAANGQAGLDALRVSPLPSIVLLDLMMPIKDGFQFRAEQLGDPALAHVPVVVMSADHDVERKSESLKAQNYLKKPVEIEELIKILSDLCN
ncbi:MAG: response regulator transcription factor [Deltaproteobacteria bacterium]|nr:response regulator transcription factor [Deltaproteobacteria bacterium]